MIGDRVVLKVAADSKLVDKFRIVGETEGGRLIVVPDAKYHELGVWAESARVTNVTRTALAPR